jgi:hypothetical protein
MTDRFIISSSDYIPIQGALNANPYLTASIASSSCGWDGYVWCDVTIPNDQMRIHAHRWLVLTASMQRFIDKI